MITCKEDLFNTYVKNKPELRREFLSLAVKFGLIDIESEICESDEDAVVACWCDVTGDTQKVGCWSAYADRVKAECRELTLSDLKPRTKPSYEKVDLSLCDFIEGFQAGKLFYYQGGEYHQIETERQAMFHASRDSYFVEVEKTIEWWEDAADYVNKEDSFGGARFEDGHLIVDGNMTRDQWCDFARILLEQ